MKKKTIHCERCKGEITSKDDLVVTSLLYEVVAYHNSCFTKDIKSAKSLIVDNHPVNGTAGNVTAVLSLILFPIGFLIFEYWIFSFVFLISPIIRIVSWLMYERHLE